MGERKMGTHAIIVIKNKNNEYLQYFEKKWDSYLFLNCKINNAEETKVVIEKIASCLNIESNQIECNYKGIRKHKKFSEKDKIEKKYIHIFFEVKINCEINNNEFEINNIKYKWFSYEKLKNDDRIMQVNEDIVGFIKELNL